MWRVFIIILILYWIWEILKWMFENFIKKPIEYFHEKREIEAMKQIAEQELHERIAREEQEKRIEDQKDSIILLKENIVKDYAKKINDLNFDDYYAISLFAENCAKDIIESIKNDKITEDYTDIITNEEYLIAWIQKSHYFSSIIKKYWILENKIQDKEKEIEDKHENMLKSLNIFTRYSQSNIPLLLMQNDISSILSSPISIINDKIEVIKNYLQEECLIDQIASKIESKRLNDLNEEIELHNKWVYEQISQLDEYVIKWQPISDKNIKTWVEKILDQISLPPSYPVKYDIEYSSEEKIIVIDFFLPNIAHNTVQKEVMNKSWIVLKPLNKKETKERKNNIHPAILLRIAYEIANNDLKDTIKTIVINGKVEFYRSDTWRKDINYVSSLIVSPEEIRKFNLSKIEPLISFQSLKGQSSFVIDDIVPIFPKYTIDMNDKRVVETKEIIDNLQASSNLASMDWKDFESLITELFEKYFKKIWLIDIKISTTQWSKDLWVDAIAWNPDPVIWWKYIFQAKRYTNVVWVGAVRELYWVMQDEWASKWILITTSTFWAEAYNFIKWKPISLISWSELLGLLQEYWYNFRIDLKEAKLLQKKSYF